jgi:NADPH-dependent 2,4-dienoyl-CoA reductase/sulfur reductase-like enzyme
MKFAETAALGGHEVTLLESATELGGQLRYAGRLPGRDGWLWLIDDLSASIQRLGVDCRLATTATASSIRAFRADLTVLATGSTWDTSGYSPLQVGRESVPRAAEARIVDPLTAISGTEDLGERIVIVEENGDCMPIALAIRLAEAGRSVTVVTQQAAVGRRIGPDSTVDFAWLYPRAIRAGVEVVTEVALERIEAHRVILRGVFSPVEQEIAANDVIFCLQRRSDDDLYRTLRQDGAEVRRIGDCVAPREVDDALFDGLRVARAI